ncbi:MAG: pyrroloquinoline quinone-dependent dehydrogenase [Acidobacteriota bacterium]|nr:pyrroloquinoline quinone-dependent dehydrogenase [Acidobacteriota bacterium]
MRKHISVGGALVVGLAGVVTGSAAWAQRGADGGEWRVHGGDSGFTRYSSLAQIDSSNVDRLEVVWEWTTADAPILAEHTQLSATNFEGVPLVVDGVLYGTTALGQAYALDAATGATRWVFNPEAVDVTQRSRSGLGFVNRGPAYWADGDDQRLFFGALNARVYALDPKTGELVEEFGGEGWIDTREGIPRIANPSQYTVTSAPAICRNVITVGARIPDGALRRSMPPGYIRGWDVRTGKTLWTFHSVPLEGEPGNETWERESWVYSGNTNVWGNISADEEFGLFYLPFGTPTNDFFGGDRHGDNLYAESLVAVKAETGEVAWYFQMIHHGLWDYDLPTPPVLADIEVGGRRIKALAQVSKQGFTYVFDRATGEPVWPIEERPVPQTDVPGEKTAPTQPFPTKPPPFERQGITVDDLIDFTPELRAEAVKLLDNYVYGPLYTPPSIKGTLLLPSYGGGANWPGASLDPETGWLYIPSMSRLLQMKLVTPDKSRSDFAYVRTGSRVEGPQGLPLIKPPYGRVTATDLNTGENVWMVPNGGDGPRDHPAIVHLDLPPLGTPTRAATLVTKTLLFVTEGSGRSGSAIGGGKGFRALDKRTGAELWKTMMDGQVTSNPITFLANGRQLVAVPVGSDPPKLVALGLR